MSSPHASDEQELTDLQFAILDALYFVEPFETLVEEVGEREKVIGDELKTMIHRKWVQVMRFDEEAQDYVRSSIMDVDDLRAYRYLATKEGLMKHTGRR